MFYPKPYPKDKPVYQREKIIANVLGLNALSRLSCKLIFRIYIWINNLSNSLV